MSQRNIFFIALIVAASGTVSPPIALAIGLGYGLAFERSENWGSRDLSKFLLQASVVCLGFGMNLHDVVRAGRSGFLYTAVGITASMTIGLTSGRLMGVGSTSSLLITAGTAICGGSAIAAIGPIANASEDEMAISLATVFVLNSIALFAFPAIGWTLHLSQSQFGLWSALAIHDTSSVVGAAAKYGSVALAIGMTVKLARALDRALVGGDRNLERDEDASSVAVVHLVLLYCRSCKHIPSGSCLHIFDSEPVRKDRTYSNSVSHRHGPYTKNNSTSRSSAAHAGNCPLGRCRSEFAGVDSNWLHRRVIYAKFHCSHRLSGPRGARKSDSVVRMVSLAGRCAREPKYPVILLVQS
jgi:hypothetical protein